MSNPISIFILKVPVTQTYSEYVSVIVATVFSEIETFQPAGELFKSRWVQNSNELHEVPERD